MQHRVGELKGRTAYREIIRTSIITITSEFDIKLLQNDVPVMLHYKHKNNPWKTLLINNSFVPEAVPHNSDVYLSASIDNTEHVIYDIKY